VKGGERVSGAAFLGTIVNTVGLRGEVRLNPGPDFWKGALDAANVDIVSAEGERRSMHVDSFRKAGHTYALRLGGVSTIEAAEGMVGSRVEVPLDGVSAADRPSGTLPCELIGLTVRLPGGTVLGTVIDLLMGPSQNCLIVEREGERFLVPDAPGIVKEIDIPGGAIEIDPPDGLLDLRW